MSSPIIDKRSREDIVNAIKEKALSYTPEWRMDEEKPDIGTALALVYADMFAGSVNQFNGVPFKNKVEFFSRLGSSLLPAIPAKGYASFSLVNEQVGSVEVPAGEILSADTDDEEGEVRFETTDDVLVVAAAIDAIFEADDRRDYIAPIYSASDIQPEKDTRLYSFASQNEQSHKLYFSHDFILDLRSAATVELRFFSKEELPIDRRLLEMLADTQKVEFSYSAKSGTTMSFVPFSSVSVRDGALILKRTKDQLPADVAEIEGQTSYTLCCTVKDITGIQELRLERMALRAQGKDIACDAICSNSADFDRYRFAPFGERFGLYDEVYFGSDEVLGKRGAEITLSFNLDFELVPIDTNESKQEFEYKWITDRSEFQVDREYKISIDEVVWEYYNGFGWARLYPDKSYGHLFSIDQDIVGQYKTVKFVCPDEIQRILINSTETYYIRAKIMKINNQFKIKGHFVSPVMTNTLLSYEYRERCVHPQTLLSVNNRMAEPLSYEQMLSKEGAFRPFVQMGLEKPALYMGLTHKPEGSPVKLLVTMCDSNPGKFCMLKWEYWDGAAFRVLNMVDETDGFSKTGIVSLLDNPGFTECTLFGRSLFWLRITDVEGRFAKDGGGVSPAVSGFYMNTTKIQNVDVVSTEQFTVEIYQENTLLRLGHSGVTEIEVYVDELGSIPKAEAEALVAGKTAHVVNDEAGLEKNLWVKWERTADFIDADSSSRRYIVNCTEGTITFGNGKHGKIPPASRFENILVKYKCGGGARTNQQAGKINKLNRSVGFINAVHNPQAVLGGCDVETLHEAVTREACMVRTQHKAVTARDFEEIARYASRNIQSVKCFAGYDDQGNRLKGAVTLVVLLKDFSHSEQQFISVKQQVVQELRDKTVSSLSSPDRLFVIKPQFVEMRIRAEIAVSDMNQVFGVKKAVDAKLADFLDASHGNFDRKGWKIGTLPNEIQIRNAIMDIDHIRYVRNIYISTFIIQAGGRREIDIDTFQTRKYILPLNSTHEIVVTLA